MELWDNIWTNQRLGGNIFEYFQKDHPMTGEEIATELNTSRQHISQQLKKIMERAYNHVKVNNKDMTPFKIAVRLAVVFGINQRDENEVKKFFKLFPMEVRAKIKDDGKKVMVKYRL